MTEQSTGERDEIIEESRTTQERIWEAQRTRDYIQKFNPKVEIVVHPRCTEILNSTMTASQKMEGMIKVFLAEYPTYLLPYDEELHHPSYLARYFDIPMWLVEQCGDAVEFCKLNLAAGKEWFAVDENSRLKKSFCFKFESLGLVSPLGEIEEMKPVWDEYCAWMGYKR